MATAAILNTGTDKSQCVRRYCRPYLLICSRLLHGYS